MAIFYVNQNATGDNDGSSWINAYSDLQDALAVATANDEIWVADGTYKPTNDGDRNSSFVIPSGVEIYGGFAGGETNREQRNWINHSTILSGNIGSENVQTDNSYHVVGISNTTNTTILDGFTISDGNADGGGSSGKNDGGGIYSFRDSNATLKNLIVSNNLATDDGGGFYYAGGGSPNLINVTFSNNFANDRGGAIYVFGDSLSVENGLFIENESQSGGAIALRDGTFNVAEILNSTFYNNQANEGSAIIYSFNSSQGSGTLTIENSIFSNNSGSDSNNQIVSGGRGTNIVNNSIVEGGYDGSGTNIIDADPLFFDTENNDLRLRRNSPGVDAGNNNVVDETTDIITNPRIFNDTVDIGAYEYGVFMSIDDTTLVEGDDGTTNAAFTVTLLDSLGEATAEEVSVNYETVDDTATASSDYTTTEGTLVFSVGETTKTINIPILGDELIENHEKFFLELSGLNGNAILSDSRGIGTITNDDLPREITIADASVDEGDEGETAIEFTISLNESYIEDITVDYDVFEDTATPGDYIDTEGTVTFAPGETEQTISVLVSGDLEIEADETFALQLSNPNENGVIVDESGIGTITNDDLPREITIADASVDEGDEGETAIEFTISLNESYIEDITVDYDVFEDTATPGDYIDTEGTVTFAPGETEQTISILVSGDLEIETNETFGLQLINPSDNAVIIDERATGTITNDDRRKVKISDATIGEGDGGEQIVNFSIALNESFSERITVDYNITQNNATSEAFTGTATFEPGETEKAISVELSSDPNSAENENFFVQLNSPSDNALIEEGSELVTVESTPLTSTINRFQNSDIPGTYIFAGEAESEGIRDNFSNFEEEGLAFKVADEPGDDLIPLYRFQSTLTPGTYIFAGEAERQSINANFSDSFNEEGLAFYVYGVGSEQGTEFIRFQNEERPGTYLFAGPNEAESIRNNFPNFIEEGAAFKVGI
ncbi:hypothetical protein H1P_1040013 [Hyella patelloides LEGE 07179]|uniref:Calx-beta domain-containing protein n=1 Tax=Hyella patelloides LEGE 07179 TaxID=945734 RepID=A0A563VJ54_9CYAN|nr:Calx-beta domain-containing protein [Hyella patelloides]VEP11439.1 hypothetical protein H1P_1040013 [Hyella patelloides LEGE 07179]